MSQRIVKGVAVVAAALTVAACGESGPTSEQAASERVTGERLAAAQEATIAEGTARMAVELATTTGGGNATSFVGEGEVDFAGDQLVVDMGSPGGEGKARSVVDGDTLYVRQDTSATDDEYRWYRFEDPRGGPTTLIGTGVSGSAPEPAKLLEVLGAVEGPVDSLGADEVRGEPVDGFGFTTSVGELAGDAAVPDRMAEIPAAVEAWLDSDNRMRRLSTTFELADLRRAQTPDGRVPLEMPAGRLVFTLELFDFGADVVIEVPEENEVVDPTQPTGAGAPPDEN